MGAALQLLLGRVTWRDFNEQGAPGFYPFIYKLDSTCVAHGANPTLVGRRLPDKWRAKMPTALRVLVDDGAPLTFGSFEDREEAYLRATFESYCGKAHDALADVRGCHVVLTDSLGVWSQRGRKLVRLGKEEVHTAKSLWTRGHTHQATG